jgi:hypothetical protein
VDVLFAIGGHFIHRPHDTVAQLLGTAITNKPSLAFVVTWLQTLFDLIPSLPPRSRWAITKHMQMMVVPALIRGSPLPSEGK